MWQNKCQLGFKGKWTTSSVPPFPGVYVCYVRFSSSHTSSVRDIVPLAVGKNPDWKHLDAMNCRNSEVMLLIIPSLSMSLIKPIWTAMSECKIFRLAPNEPGYPADIQAQNRIYKEWSINFRVSVSLPLQLPTEHPTTDPRPPPLLCLLIIPVTRDQGPLGTGLWT